MNNNFEKEKRKTKEEKRQEILSINRKNGVDAKQLTKLRIRSQLTLSEVSGIAGIEVEIYDAWEHEKEPISLDKYHILMEKFRQEINSHRCNNCYYYNGEPGDGVEFCDQKEIYVPEENYCVYWLRRDAYR